MRVLKCYLANDREGHFVTAGEAMMELCFLWLSSGAACQHFQRPGVV